MLGLPAAVGPPGEQLIMPDIECVTFGRTILTEVGPEVDECGQFEVRLLVDGKLHFNGWFTDKSEEPGRPLGANG